LQGVRDLCTKHGDPLIQATSKLGLNIWHQSILRKLLRYQTTNTPTSSSSTSPSIKHPSTRLRRSNLPAIIRQKPPRPLSRYR
jgi:hypothetical protein